MPHSTPKVTVAIAGGGIAGLSLAAGLYSKHSDIDFHVYEGAKEYKDIGGGLAIHGNGINAMILIDPRLKQAYMDKGLLMGEEGIEMSTEIVVAQGPFKGELVTGIGKAKDRKTVSRADLLEGFGSLIPRDKITFGRRLQEIHEHEDGTVELTFLDGTQARADCLIGADGVHSPTRRYILGPDHPNVKAVNPDDWYLYRRRLPMSEAKALGLPERWETGIPIMIGNKGYINSMPLDKGATINIAVCRSSLPVDSEGKVPPLNPDDFCDYTEDAKRMVQIVAESDELGWGPADHDPAPTYVKGRVCMVGDAAHATMPFNGQGAAQAIEDSAVLDALFGSPLFTSPQQLPTLFAAYDATRRPRSQRVVEIARQFGRTYQFEWGNVHENLDDMRAEFAAGGRYTNAFDVKKQNEDAVELFEKRVKEGKAVS